MTNFLKPNESCIEDQSLSKQTDFSQQLAEELKGIDIKYLNLIVFVMQDFHTFSRPSNECIYDFLGQYETEILDNIVDKLSQFQDQTYQYCKHSFPEMDKKTFSEYFETARRILINPNIEFVPIKRLSQTLNEEENLQRKKEILNDIDAKIQILFTKNKYVCGDDDSLLTYQEILNGYIPNFVSQCLGDKFISIFDLEEILRSIRLCKFEIALEEGLGHVDIQKLSEQTKLYGAKGANLEIISNLIQTIKEYIFVDYIVPDFERIGVEVYRKWKEGQDIQQDLKEYFQWIKGREIIVRSSAVFSEDNEQTTGAGIYESIKLEECSTFNQFVKAIIDVFKSVDTQRAKQYRKQNNIEQEEMGVVLQEYVEAWTGDDKGYVNTVLKQVPQLMDIVLENGMRPVIQKHSLKKHCVSHDERESIFHYQIDGHRIENTNIIEDLAKLSYILEKYYGQPIQIEFIFSEKDEKEGYTRRGRSINIVQTRFLPKNFLEPANVEFPDKEIVFEGRALGIVDTVLDVLPNYEDNSEKEGVVIFESSIFGSLGTRFSDQNFPKKGVVIILEPSNENFGHIETLCAEKGLYLIFNDHYYSQRERHMMSIGMHASMDANPISDLFGLKKLHLVLNGLIGKIYTP